MKAPPNVGCNHALKVRASVGVMEHRFGGDSLTHGPVC